jgi:hypothetical protein
LFDVFTAGTTAPPIEAGSPTRATFLLLENGRESMEKHKREKLVIFLLCMIGVLGVAYGMTFKNDPVFVVGLIFVIAGYWLIRKKLKGTLRKRS